MEVNQILQIIAAYFGALTPLNFPSLRKDIFP